MLQRAAMNEEIADGEISVQDIQQILLNEYSLKVINVSGQCSLGHHKTATAIHSNFFHIFLL